jgi:DNA repair protein RecO (recombination protein O)
MLTKDLAICIHAVDYSETSQVVTFFTRETGKISAIAKGSKRPKSAFGGPIEILAYGDIVFTATGGEKLATLTEFEQKPGFNSPAENLFALNCALFAAELVTNLTDEYDPHPQLFDNFVQFLQNVREIRDTRYEPRNNLALLILFQLSLLKEVGLQPILSYCVNCKTRYERPAATCRRWHGGRVTSDELYFSSSANGLLCKDCEANFPDKIRLTKTAANFLSNLKLIANGDEKTLLEIEKVFVRHFTEILRRTPKMAKYVLKP